MDLPTFDPAAIAVRDLRKLPPPPQETVFDVIARGIKRSQAEGDPFGIRRWMPATEAKVKVPRFRGPGYTAVLPVKMPSVPIR